MPRTAFIPAPGDPHGRQVVSVPQKHTQEPQRASSSITTAAFLGVVLTIGILSFMAISIARSERSEDIEQRTEQVQP